MEKNQIKDYLNKAVMGLGVLMFLSVFSQSVRTFFGKVVDIFMNPIVGYVGESNLFLILFVLAVVTALYSSLIQKYVVDQSFVIEFQEKMKVFQKEMREAQKTQNTFQLKRLEEQQAEMMQMQSTLMKEQMKPMLYIVIVSIPLYMWIYYYIGGHPSSSLIFPFWGEKLLNDVVFAGFQFWLVWSFVSSLAISQIIRKVLNIGAPGV